MAEDPGDNTKPIDEIIQRLHDRQDTTHKLDQNDAEYLLRWMELQTPRYAKVTNLGYTYRAANNLPQLIPNLIAQDEWMIDIYDKGYTLPPTLHDIFAYQLDTNIIYANTVFDQQNNVSIIGYGQRIRVAMLHDGSALIMPPILPQDTGQYKVLMLIDILQPGTAAWDYPRFSK